MDTAPTKEGKKRRAMRMVCIWAALPVLRGGWQFWARLTLRTVEHKRVTFQSEYQTSVSLWRTSPQRTEWHRFRWTFTALIKYSTTPDPVWVKLPKVFYFEPCLVQCDLKVNSINPKVLLLSPWRAVSYIIALRLILIRCASSSNTISSGCWKGHGRGFTFFT